MTLTTPMHETPALASADVAIVHDYLNQLGGAERVALELSEIWPGAPIYTSLYRPESTWPGFRQRDVRPTPLDRLPVDRGFRNLFPLYPLAFRAFGQIDADVVLASSSGWAHMASPAPGALHVVYCHTPARWLYSGDHLATGGHRLQRALARPSLGVLRRVDRRAARRADLYIGNSEAVRGRIKAVYGIEAAMVHPPVDVDRFTPKPRGERLLVISRLLPYKRVDLVVRAAGRIGLGLDVVGTGPELSALRGIAGPGVTFHGSLGDDDVVELMEGARTVCVAGEEDFGLVAVEGQAAGKPVVAYGAGGALETIDEGMTGVFFREWTPESVIDAIARAEHLDTPPADIARRAQRFSRETFRTRMTDVISACLARRAGDATGAQPMARARREPGRSAG